MKKNFALIGMLAGIAVIVVGILALSGVLGDASSYGGSSPYDAGYASFGGDYYTYSVNNAAEAASGARAAAYNLVTISDFCQTCGGLFLILFGLMAICGFGIVYADCCTQKCAEIEEKAAIDEVTEEKEIALDLYESSEDDEIETEEVVGE